MSDPVRRTAVSGLRLGIHSEQARLLHAQQPAAIAYLLGISLAVGWALAGSVPWPRLTASCGLLLASATQRCLLWHRLRGVALGRAAAHSYLRQLWGLNLMEGLCASLFASWSAPYLAQQQFAFLFCVLMLGGTVSLIVNAASFPAFLLRSLPAQLTVIALQLQQGAAGRPAALAVAALAATLACLALRLARLHSAIYYEQEELQQVANDLLNQTASADGESSNRARQFAAASHDVRQPMHALCMYLDTLARLRGAAPWDGMLRNAQQCAASIGQMFASLLDLAPATGPPQQVRRQPFPLAGLLELVRTEFQPLAWQRGLELRMARCQAWTDSDPELVQRILRNLVLNACQYTRHGAILVGVRRRAGTLQLQVWDTGIGIAPAQQKQVFDEFFQVNEKSYAAGQGLGLGLALVRRMAAMLQAPLALRSTPGNGSCFSLCLPHIAAPTAPRMPQQDDAPGLAGGGACVLVIDNEAAILDASRALLTQWGYRVLTASGSADALRQLAAGAPDPAILLCDYRLQQEDGLAVIAAFQQRLPQLRAILVTGDSATPALPAGLTLLCKPLQPEHLRAALARLRGHAAHAA